MNKLELSFAAEAYRVLEEKIVTLELAPNALLIERDLIALSGRGRTPTREAVQRLERDMLLQILPRRGILIEPIDIPRTLMTLDVRVRLEPMVMERAALYAYEDASTLFRQIAAKIDDSMVDGDQSDFPCVDRKLTQLAMQIARHEVAEGVLLPLHALSRRIVFLAAEQKKDRQRESSALHAVIVRAIADNDPQKAALATAELIALGRAIALTVEEDGLAEAVTRRNRSVLLDSQEVGP